MKRLFTFCLMALFSMFVFSQQTITVTANSEEISNGLDLKIVAKVFAEAKNLEEFENILNNPDSMFCNLDINGDGNVDYLRVIETGEGDKRLIVLQAVLAQDIYQDVASIYVEKDVQNNVTVQIIGDEYVYGTNYVIEPVYIYRPVIYTWLWSSIWYPWHSPYYWNYYPHWWYAHHCWLYNRYWDRCYLYHRHHHWCSYRHHHNPPHHYHDMHRPVSRHEYADRHADRSFHNRNTGIVNARDIHSGRSVERTAVTRTPNPTVSRQSITPQPTRRDGTVTQRPTQQTSVTRTSRTSTTQTRTTSVKQSSTTQRTTQSVSGSRSTSTRSGSSTPTRTSGNVSRPVATPTRSGGSVSRPSGGMRTSSGSSRGGSSGGSRRR